MLKRARVSVFYDEFHKATLWGKDLFQHLQAVYRDKAQYCVVFVSKSYVEKNWTKHELQQAQARAFIEKAEYILPIRLDDTDLPGLNPTVGYIDLRSTTVKQVVLLLLKLGRSTENGSVVQKKYGDLEGEFITYNGHVLSKDWPAQIEEAQYKPYMFVTAPFERIRYGKEKMFGRSRNKKLPPTCHDCGVVQGQLHVPSCDMEECPACGGQAIACGCKHKDASEVDVLHFEEGEEAEGVIRVTKKDGKNRVTIELVREGEFLAEVSVDLIEDEGTWSPYLSLEGAQKLDAVRKALREGDIASATKYGRVFELKLVAA